MTTIVTRLFDTYEHASLAVTELEANGIPHSAISLVANNTDDRYSNVVPATTTGTTAPVTTHDTSAGAAAGTGASLGTVLGGGAGLLAGLGMLAIPGVGPVVAAGWLIATAVGAGVGAASGGIIGSLVGAGVSETDAHVYAEGVRRGGTLVTVRLEDAEAATAERILDKHGAVDTVARGDAFRAEGWSRFDEQAPAYRAGAAADMGTPGRGTPIL
jgi:hypothetical protein